MSWIRVAQVERNAVEHQLASLDLGEVEDLVDDPQQVVGGFLDGVQVVQLTWRQLAFLQQMGKAEDAVERGADLVAHVGQELRLDAAGLEGLLARHVQLDVLDFDGFQVLAYVFGGLIDAVLQVLRGRFAGFRPCG